MGVFTSTQMSSKLIAVGLLAAVQGVSAGGGGKTWTDGYYADYSQPLFVELCVFLCITTLAVGFEVGHHVLHHWLGHTVKFHVLDAYGQKRHAPAGRAKDQLMGGNAHVMALFDRISGELMVLGFVAFVVWACYQGEMFKTIADSLAKNYTSSPDYYFIYNACHNVHIFLFLAMVSHFVLSSYVIKMVMNSQLRLRSKSTNDGSRADKIRQVFVKHYKDEGLEGMDDSFNFALYLSLNLDRILADFHAFHISAWMMLLLIKAIECCVMGETVANTHWSWYDSFIITIILGSLSPIVIGIFVAVGFFGLKKVVNEGKFPEAKGCAAAIGAKIDVEMWLSRLFQALTFTLSYEFMKIVACKDFWKGNLTLDWPHSKTESIVIWLIPLLIMVIVNAILLPKGIMNLTYKYSLPPYVDSANMDIVKAVIAYGKGDEANAIEPSGVGSMKLEIESNEARE